MRRCRLWGVDENVEVGVHPVRVLVAFRVGTCVFHEHTYTQQLLAFVDLDGVEDLYWGSRVWDGPSAEAWVFVGGV